MVEFGLKLEDNKVEEWSDKYIDYEKLKKLIKKAKKACENRAELEKRIPSAAAYVKSNYEKEREKISLNDFDSNSALNKISEHSGPDSGDEASNDYANDYANGERVLLLPFEDELSVSNKYGSNNSMNRAKYGSNENFDDADARSASTTSLTSFFQGVKRGFQFSTYETKLQDALQEETLALENFSIVLYQEVSKVNSFYRGISEEMENQVNFLSQQAGPNQFKKRKNRKQPLQNRVRMSLQKRMSILTNGPPQNQIHSQNTDDSDDEIELELNASERAQRKEKVREADSIKRALTDLHRRGKLLSNYVIMNSTGFIKIIKKFTKSFPRKKSDFKHIAEDGFICGDGKRVRGLCTRMEQYYANWFCGGNETEARSQLLPKKGDVLDMDWSQLRLGYRLGMCSILVCWVTWDCIWGYVKDGHSTIGGRTAFPVFRACGGLLLVHWFWGFSVYVWNRYRINYIFLFDFDPRIVDTPISIFEDATDETLVFLILMLLYYKAGAEAIPEVIPQGGYPFLLVLYTIKCLIFPWKTRKPMWRAILSVITAPITAPTFFHTYVADVFTSMVKVFQDILWTVCFIASGDFLITDGDLESVTANWHATVWYNNIVIPLICLFPLVIRFNQCLRRYADTGKRIPNLANAFKYAMSQTVTLFGAFHPLYLMHKNRIDLSAELEVEELTIGPPRIFDMFWFGIFVASSLYSYFWDVYMDWGLGRLKHAFLGSRLMYPNKSYYYAVMAMDLFLRFMWVTTLIPPQSGAKFEIPNYLTLVTMAIELFRRMCWGFFRVEHEHRHNTSGFRRVDFVPLHFSTGHDHHYKRKEHVGWNVLGEVVMITAIVCIISAASVIAAQKATHGMAMRHSNEANDDL